MFMTERILAETFPRQQEGWLSRCQGQQEDWLSDVYYNKKLVERCPGQQHC